MTQSDYFIKLIIFVPLSVEGFRVIKILLSKAHRGLCMRNEHYSVVQVLRLRIW